jgi:hypothetical protein
MYTVSMNHTFEITHPVPGKHGVLCPCCKHIRNPKSFRYPITKAQALARSYKNHDERPMHTTAKVCAFCRANPPNKKERDALIAAGDTSRLGVAKHLTVNDLQTMRREQLRIELDRGRIRRVLVEAELRRRDMQREAIRHAAGVKGAAIRWERHDDARWAWVVGELSREMQRVANKRAYTRHAMQVDGDPLSAARFKFNTTYKNALRAARKQARVGLGDATDDTYTWGQLISHRRMRILEARWAAIDHLGSVQRRRGRPASVPLLLMLKDIDVFKHIARVPKPSWGLDDRSAEDRQLMLRSCPVGARVKRTLPVPRETSPFKLFAPKFDKDTSWDM